MPRPASSAGAPISRAAACRGALLRAFAELCVVCTLAHLAVGLPFGPLPWGAMFEAATRAAVFAVTGLLPFWPAILVCSVFVWVARELCRLHALIERYIGDARRLDNARPSYAVARPAAGGRAVNNNIHHHHYHYHYGSEREEVSSNASTLSLSSPRVVDGAD